MSEEFVEFPKMARLMREIIITEKLDGTNAQVWISDDLSEVRAGSRTRWITPTDDNFGFAAWVEAHREELLTLGPGRHYGEWWGCGIQRNYGLKEKRFSLFNVQRWVLHGAEPKPIQTTDPRVVKMQQVLPPCCGLVPVLYRGQFSQWSIDDALYTLRIYGSAAVKGFPKPEGIVVYHVAGNVGFKRTIEKDDEPKTRNAR